MGVAAGLLLLGALLFAGGTAQAAPAAPPSEVASSGEVGVTADMCWGAGSGWFCFYEHQGFGGRVQAFTVCGQFNLNFWDEATSWKHQQYGVAGVTVYNYAPSTPTQLWTMTGDNNSSTLVAASHNDKADYYINYC
jgi:hypothetical protein